MVKAPVASSTGYGLQGLARSNPGPDCCANSVMAPPRLPRYRSRGLALGLALAGLAAGIRERPSVATKPPKAAPVERWIRTAATVRVDAPAAACYAAYSDLTRMPEAMERQETCLSRASMCSSASQHATKDAAPKPV